jgi:hypothetical protein
MKRLVQCAVIAALTYVSAPAEAQTLELEGALVGSGASVGPGFRFGVVLTDRLTIGAGVSASFYSMDSPVAGVGSLGGLAGGAALPASFGFAIPVDLKIWILPAASGSVSPTIRIVGSYARQSAGNFDETTAYGGGVLAGAAYMVDETIGFSLEAGVEYARIFHESYGLGYAAESLQVGYRASLVLRI